MIKGLPRLLREQRGVENVIFGALLMVFAAPLWSLSQIPTQDGSAHLYNAYLLSGWWKTSFPVDRAFFAFNPAPVPNWFSTVMLALLMQVFSPQVAERVLLTSYVVFLPLAFRYASRSFDHIPRYTYFLGFVLVWNYFFQLGFFNFCLSLAWYLFFVGYWARNRGNLGTRQVVNLFLLSILLYFSNGLSYYLAAGTIGLLSIAALAKKVHGDSQWPWWYAVAMPQVGLLLALPLSVLFFTQHGKYYATRGVPMTLGSLSWSVTRLPILLPSFSTIDLKLSALFAIVLLISAAIACCARRHREQKFLFSDVVVIAAAVQFVLYVIAPEHAGGGGFINDRILLFSLVTFTLWIAIQQYDKITTAAIAAAALLISLGLQARTFEHNRWLSARLDEYSTAANHIDENKSLWAFDLDPAGSGYPYLQEHGLRYDPFEHAGAMLALQRNLVDLNNYETASKNFPIVYKNSVDPFGILEKLPRDGGPRAWPPMVDFAKYYQTTGQRVDYVLLWDLHAKDHTNPSIQNLLQQLSSDYALIYCAPNIPLQLYQLRSQVSTAQASEKSTACNGG